jgi:hypothetical protein
MGSSGLSTVLGVVFLGLALFYAAHAVRAGCAHDRACHALCVLMCAAMAAMLGPWTASVPTGLGIAVFTAAALWFCYRALFTRDASHRTHPWIASAEMAAMVWMYVAMSPEAARPIAEERSALPDAHAAMAGMAMPGMTMPDASAGGTPAWSLAISGLVATLLVVGALWYLRRPLLAAVRGRSVAAAARLDDMAAAVMAIGMAVAFALLL